MNSDRRYLIVGGVVLALLLLAIVVPNFRQGAASLSHPDPAGPTAWSKSALGHLAFHRLLDTFEIPTTVSESGSSGYVANDNVLVIAEPRTDDATLTDVRAMLNARNVLLVLPKRSGKPDPQRPYWIAQDKLVSEDAVLNVLHLVDEHASLVRNASLSELRTDFTAAGAPAIEEPQLIHSRTLRPLRAYADGILVGERQTPTGRVLVLSDPDLIANFSLARGDNSVLAMSLIQYLRAPEDDGTVIFDEFVHGFSEKPFQFLSILSQFPFNLVTVQIGLAAALLLWAAAGRFGAPTPLAQPLEAGKRSLIDNATRLLAQSGRAPELSQRYFEEMVRDTGRRLRAPGGLDLAALLAWLNRAPGAAALAEPGSPQRVWTWRKELLGGSRTNPNAD